MIQSMEVVNKEIHRTNWLYFIILVFFIKFLVFCIDPLPMFFLGDSASYIHTALTGWIPPDRSFVYGFIIRLTAVFSFSLTSLTALQVFTSGLNAVLLSYSLLHFFSVTPRIAFFSGFICALEPLQLMYERYVMTEALSLFLFVIYIVVIFHYLKEPKLIFIPFIQIVGTGLISLRLSFLPIILINSIALPLLSISFFFRKYSLRWTGFKALSQKMRYYRPVIIVLMIHMIASIGLTYCFHSGYKHLNGLLSKQPPAYQYQSGIFLLVSWAPVVKPVDFPRPELTDIVFSDLKYDLKDYHTRSAHHWEPGGLISHINIAVPDFYEADRVAGETAINAMKRDPFGIASLAIKQYLDYWHLDILRAGMRNDRGAIPLPKDMLEWLRDYFGLYADSFPFLKTFTNRFFFSAWPWYLFLICIPFLTLIVFFICKRNVKKYIFIIFLVSAISIAVTCSVTDGVTIRYLQPLGWLSFLIIGFLIDRALIKGENMPLLKSFSSDCNA